MAMVAVAVPLYAASPTVNQILPRGGQRGTEVSVRFQGNNLGDVQEILCHHTGITVKKIETITEQQVTVLFTIDANCRLGEHAFRVRTATGISDLRTFWVGALPQIDEKEPNNDFATAQAIPMNITVNGVITNEDADYFVVECKKGQRLSVEIEAMRLATSVFDPTVTIYNEKQFELAISDDDYRVGRDSTASIAVPADGKYYIQVREASYTGAPNFYYRLHVGHFPCPTGVVPAGGKPGETIEVRFLGDPLGEFKQKVTLPTTDLTMARVHAQTAEGIHPCGLRLMCNDLPSISEAGNANTLKSAMTGPLPAAFHGSISAPGEVDHIRFTAKKGQVFDIRCHARRLGSALDPFIHIQQLDKNGVPAKDLIANDDADGHPDSHIRFSAPEDADYALLVHDHLRNGAVGYFYRVEIQNAIPTANVSLPMVDGNNPTNQDRQMIVVPKGGRRAIPVAVRRSDWGGPATLMIDKLPAGVTLSHEPIDFSQPQVIVILEAKPDAAVGGGLLDAKLVPADVNVKPLSGVKQDIQLSGGNNGNNYHSMITDRLGVGVTEGAPFSIEIVEPKVPLVQNGGMNLKIIAKRQPGFTGAITVNPVTTPNGLGIGGSTVILENATECLVPLNAAANAAPRKFKLAFMGFANTGKGNVWVGTQLASLEIVPPFVAFTQQRTAIEQGSTGVIVCKIATTTPFTGKAKAFILGLPNKATAKELEIDATQAEVTFEVQTDKTTPAGKHNVFCQVIIVKDGESIIHNVGGGELRVDVPRPAPAATTAAPKPVGPKPVSRLDQLRQEQAAKENAGGAKPEPKK